MLKHTTSFKITRQTPDALSAKCPAPLHVLTGSLHPHHPHSATTSASSHFPRRSPSYLHPRRNPPQQPKPSPAHTNSHQSKWPTPKTPPPRTPNPSTSCASASTK